MPKAGMESHNYHNRDYSIVLRDEIAILLAQTRLIELYAKQAQATAATELAQTHEQYRTAFAVLRAELAERERLLQESQGNGQAGNQDLQNQIEDLKARLEEKQQLLGHRDAELQGTRSEIASLLTRISQLEAGKQNTEAELQQAERFRRDLEAQLNALRQELRDNHFQLEQERAVLKERDEALEEQQGAMAQLEHELRSHIHELKNQLDQKERVIADRGSALREARSEVTGLQDRVAALESANQEVAASAAETQSVRRALESELIELGEELNRRQQAWLEVHASAMVSEQALRTQLAEARTELGATQALLQKKDGELQRADFQISSLEQRIAELEATDKDVANAANLIREQFESELTGLRQTLEAQETTLRDRQAAFNISEEKLTNEIGQLHALLTHKEARLDAIHTELASARTELAALREQNSQLEYARIQTEKLLSVQGEQIRERVRAELEHLDKRLREKEQALQTSQRKADETDAFLNSKIHELRLQVVEKQLLLESRSNEVNELKTTVSRLSEETTGWESQSQALQARVALLESSRDQERNAAAREAESIRGSLQAELAAVRIELQGKELALEERQVAIERLERELTSELQRLEARLAEQCRLLDAREAELQQAKSEASGLREGPPIWRRT